MALPLSDPPAPGHQPQIQVVSGLQLTEGQAALLQQAFADHHKVLVEKQFLSGYSGATTYLVTLDGHAPVVVKLAPLGELQREYDAYRQLVAPTLPQNTAHIQGEPVAAPDGQAGLLRYTFIGRDPARTTTSLQTYYSDKGGKSTSEVLDRLFRSYGKHWWTDHKLTRLVFSEDYDRLLPVHLYLAPVASPEPSSQVLQAGVTSHATLATIQPGQIVQLQGFTIAQVQANSLTLHVEPPHYERSARLRVRLSVEGTHAYHVGDPLPPLAAVVKATRLMFLNNVARQALPTFDSAAAAFSVAGHPYPNPLFHLREWLAQPYDAKVSIIHGDLNLQNILVDEATGFAWLIDFAETRRGPVLFDLQRLEVQIITKLLAPSLAMFDDQSAPLTALLAALHSPYPAVKSPIPALQDPYTLLVTVRRLARQYVVDDQDWRAYYRGLVIALIGTLKFAEFERYMHQVALLSAATLIQLAETPLLEPIDPEPLEPAPGESPFKGLHYFDVADAELFFGRETLTAELIAYLRTHPLLAVVGASGSGKSSVVRAGLVAAWQSGQPLPDGTAPPVGSQHWPVHIITPTAHPLESLAVSLTAQESATVTASLLDDLRQEPRSLYFYMRKWQHRNQLQAPGARCLFVVDQFEETFTLCRDKAERQAFIDNLLNATHPWLSWPSAASQAVLTAEAAAESESPLVVVLTLRADFYAACSEFANLRVALERYQRYIGPLQTDDLRRAIEEPARRNGWAFEPGLVDLLLHDVGDEPGALPLLSHALLETWQRRRGHTLTLAGYQAAGRVQGAIAQTAEAIYQQHLDGTQQRIAQQIFLRLTELGEGAQDTRRRVALAELLPQPEDKPLVEQVLKILADARLVIIFQTEAEIAHEALIREWPRLRDWLQDDREGLRTHRHLSEATQEWAKLDRDSGALYRGLRLAQTQEWANSHRYALNPSEREFLAASQALIEEDKRKVRAIADEREAARQRELAQAQSLLVEQARLAETERQRAKDRDAANARLRARAWLLAALSLLAILLAAAATWFGVQSNQNAHAQATEIVQRRRAEAKALENANLSATREAETNVAKQEAERQAATAHSRQLAAVSTSELSQDNYEPAILLAVEAGRISDTLEAFATMRNAIANPWHSLVVLYGHTAAISQAQWSHDDSRILTVGSEDGAARIWDSATGKELVMLTGVKQAQWSHDERRILTTSLDGTVRIWDSATGKELVTLTSPTAAIDQATWSYDDSRILTVGSEDGAARIWDSATGKELFTFKGHMAAINHAQWSHDERRILTTSLDGTVRMWDSATGKELVTLTDRKAFIKAQWSHDERRILTTSLNGTVRMWDSATGKELVMLTSRGGFSAATWSHDERRILTVGSEDGTVRIWDSATGKELVMLTGRGGFSAATWSHDERRILTTSLDGTIRIWYVRMVDLIPATCRYVPRNFTWEEWQRYMEGAYRPTCPNAPIPPDAITAIKEQIHRLVRQGDIITATAQMQELNSWLLTNGQYNGYGISTIAFGLVEDGQSLAQSGNITDAVKTYQKALELDPTLNLTAEIRSLEKLLILTPSPVAPSPLHAAPTIATPSPVAPSPLRVTPTVTSTRLTTPNR